MQINYSLFDYCGLTLILNAYRLHIYQITVLENILQEVRKSCTTTVVMYSARKLNIV